MQSRHVAGLALATVLVAGLHGLLARLDGLSTPPPPRTAPPSLQWIRLASPSPPSPLPPPPTPAPVPAPRPPSPPAATPAKPAASKRSGTLAPALAAVPAARHEDKEAQGVAKPDAAPADPPAPPLNLSLPARQAPSLVEQARSDPRIHAAPLSSGERFAQQVGTDQTVHEERRGEGRWRVRQGTGCVDLKTSRAAQLDPYRESVMPSPKLVDPCN